MSMLTQDELQVLKADLCSRLPYGGITIKLGDYDYIVHGYNSKDSQPVKIHFYKNNDPELVYDLSVYLKDYRPYLRPLSSMTDEEREEFRHMGGIIGYDPVNDIYAISAFSPEAYDWLNKKGFDYRGLIEKGLAIEKKI